eukprot:GHUV01048982.1.p1 GENE.GHUV01048982.1~~GHUV01048982.1.p1  ORF type:complete len:258 (+),score=105.51 GHUV01048982.1:1447-2220(+)
MESSSNIKAACPAGSLSMLAAKPRPSHRDVSSSQTTRSLKVLTKPSHKPPVQQAVQGRSNLAAADGTRATGTTSINSSRNVGVTSGSSAVTASCSMAIVEQVAPQSPACQHVRPSSSSSTDDCNGPYYTDDQIPQQPPQQQAEASKAGQLKEASAGGHHVQATAQQSLERGSDTAQQQHEQECQQQCLQHHKESPPPLDALVQVPQVAAAHQTGLRRLAGQYSHSAMNRDSSTSSGRTVVRTMSQPGGAAHVMQRLN